MKKLISFILSAYLASMVSPAFAQTYTMEETPSYGPAIDYVTSRGMMSPQSDGLMHGERLMSREDLAVGIVRDVYTTDIRHDCFDRIAPKAPFRFTHLFSDIKITHSSAQEICIAMLTGLINGNSDGSFGPQGSANLVEAAKVITKAYGIAPWPAPELQPRVPWHEPYWYSLAKRGAIPETVKNRSENITRGEYAEILYRLRTERPAVGFRYGTVHVNDSGGTPKSETPGTAFRHPMTVAPDLTLLTKSVPVVKEATKLSSGLAIQMHVEERKLARLIKLADAPGENHHMISS